MVQQVPPNYSSDSPLTKRDIARILTAPVLEVGIDKIRLHMPYIERVGGDDMWRKISHNPLKDSTWGKSAEHVNEAHVEIQFHESKGRLFNVEFNPSKVLYNGSKLATWNETLEVLPEIFRSISPYFKAQYGVEAVGISRLDLAVDLAPVADMDGLLNDFRAHEAIKRSKPLVYPDRVTGAYQTVIHAAKNGTRVMAYDKSAQQKTDERKLRFEVTLKSKDLGELGLRSLAATEEDLRNGFLARLLPLLEIWNASPDRSLDRILESTEETRMLTKASGLEFLKSKNCHPPISNNLRRALSAFKKRNQIGSIKDLFA